MKKLAILISLGALAGAANADLLYSNGSVANNGNLSVITAPNSTFGFNCSVAGTFRCADDFVAGAGWTAQTITLHAYQTGASNTNFTMPSVDLQILKGADISTATVEQSGTFSTENASFEAYRVSSTASTGTTRPIWKFDVNIADMNLTSGATYWVAFSINGTLASGPWVPQVMNGAGFQVGNAVQNVAAGAYAPLTSAITGGTAGVALPFEVNGTIVPEPATMIALGAGIAAVAARRRRK